MEIPGYIIHEELGSGGMSRVYLASQESLNREVALKVLTPAFATDESFTKRFIKEAKIVAKLDHSKIVTIFDVGKYNDFYYISQEYLAGGSLTGEIAQHMEMHRILFVMRCVADALGYAHQQGIVHRDVKPQNILIRSDRMRSAVLTDFGIAKTTDTQDTQLTQVGSICGSPAYISPEQARGQDLDGRSDIYSLGIVFYQMITGEIPYKGRDSLSQALMHVANPLPTLPDPYREHFQDFLEHCLAKNKEDRFQDAQELLPALKNAETSWIEAHERAPQGNASVSLLDQKTQVIRPASIANAQTVVIDRNTQPSPPRSDRRRRAATRTWLSLISLSAIAVPLTIWLLNELPVSDTTSIESSEEPQTRPNSPIEGAAPISRPSTAATGQPDTHEKQKDPRNAELHAQANELANRGIYYSEGTIDADRIYEELQRVSGEPDKYLAERERLSGLQTQRIIDLIDSEDVEQAKAQLNLLVQRAPNRVDERALRAKLEKKETEIARRLQTNQAIASLSSQLASKLGQTEMTAKDLKQSGRIVEQLASLGLAADGLARFTRSLQRQFQGNFERALNNKTYAEAKALLASWADYDKKDPAISSNRERLTTAELKQEKVNELLARASAAESVGNLVSPDDRSAYTLYQKALLIEPQNDSVISSMAALAPKVASQINEHIKQNDLKKAQALLDKGLGLFRNDPALSSTQKTIDDALAVEREQARLAALKAEQEQEEAERRKREAEAVAKREAELAAQRKAEAEHQAALAAEREREQARKKEAERREAELAEQRRAEEERKAELAAERERKLARQEAERRQAALAEQRRAEAEREAALAAERKRELERQKAAERHAAALAAQRREAERLAAARREAELAQQRELERQAREAELAKQEEEKAAEEQTKKSEKKRPRSFAVF